MRKTVKLTENTNIWKAISYSLKRGKWWAATLVNTLKMAKIRSNLHAVIMCFLRHVCNCSAWSKFWKKLVFASY